MILSLLRQVSRGVRALLRPDRADADASDEVAHFIDEATREHIASGMRPADARRAAVLAFGGASSMQEQVRTSGWERIVETTLQDVRYGLRRLRRSPSFTLTAVVTLAVGIGASTTVFSAVNPILLEPLPFPHAERLVTLDDRNPAGIPMPATLGTFEEVRDRSRSFDAVAAADAWRPSLIGSGTPERLEGQRVTARYFDVFTAIPLAGRGFTLADDEPGAPNVVILSERLATRRFGASPSAVGRTIDLNGDPYLVIGVMAHGYANVLAPAVDIWSPLRERATADLNGREWGHHYQVLARLRPGVTIDGATRDLLAIGGTPVASYSRPPWANLADGLLIRQLQETITRSARPALNAIVVSVLLLLLIASVNVANLLLARGAQRRSEMSLRLALGAGRRRVLRQLLTESVVLALLGGGLGLLVAQVAIRAFLVVSPTTLPRLDAIRLSPTAFAFAAGLTSIVGVLVGLAPALGIVRAGAAGLHLGSTRTTAPRTGPRNALVVAEVGLAIVLLLSAGLLLRSVTGLMAVAPGFDSRNVMTMQVVEAGHGFDDPAARLQFYDLALDAVRAIPGVTKAAFTSQLPLSGEVDGYGIQAQARPEVQPGDDGSALRYSVTPGYFAAMGIPLRQGRLLEDRDRRGAPPAVVINERFARRLFGGTSPIGQRVRFGPQIGSGTWMEVVGVVGDVRHYSLAVDAPDAFYTTSSQWQWVDNVATLVVKSSSPPSAILPALKTALWSVNANVPVQRVQAMSGFVTASAGTQRFALLAIESLAIVALLLAAVGLYGVISGSVSERVREIGIRTALGAAPGDVVRQVLRQALALTLAGVAIGLFGGFAASRLISSMLFGVTALDPLTHGGVVVVMVVVGLLAAWGPVRRAVRVDPTIALRAE